MTLTNTFHKKKIQLKQQDLSPPRSGLASWFAKVEEKRKNERMKE
jgi:hypothetical protein